MLDNQRFKFVVYNGGQRDVNPVRLDLTWAELVTRFTTFDEPRCSVLESSLPTCGGKACPAKMHMPWWSPVEIGGTGTRSNDNITTVTMAVFDIDHCGDIEILLKILEGYAAIVYSSHNHSPTDESYRLVMPLTEPCGASDWGRLREAIVKRFNLPADRAARDISRAYVMPRLREGVEPYAKVLEGKAISASEIENRVASISTLPAPPPTTTDLGELHDILSRVRRSKAHGNERERYQAKLLGHVLNGTPLAQPGELHESRVALCGLLGYWLPAKTTWEAVLEILRPMLATTPLGSSTFEETVEKTKRLYNQSMQSRLVRDAENERDAKEFAEWRKTKAAAIGVETEAEVLICGSIRTLAQVLREGLVLGEQKLEYDTMNSCATIGRSRLTDTDYGRIRANLEKLTGENKKGNQSPLQFSTSDIREQVDVVAHESEFNPIREYLDELTWSGESLLERVTGEILRAQATDYTRAAIRRWFISGVARIMEPGCKADMMLVLIGEQGSFKSTFFEELGKPWFNDSIIEIGHKDAYQHLRGLWICEWSELETTMRRAKDMEAVKAFISSREDHYRPSYGRHEVVVPRMCIFGATGNQAEFLEDSTGNRRFLPITVGEIDINKLRRWRDQLWAEAVEAYKKGERWWFNQNEESDKKILAELADVHEEHRVGDPWEDRVATWLENPKEIKFADTTASERAIAAVADVTTANILQYAIQLPKGQWSKSHEMRVGRIMRSLGWYKKQRDNRARLWVENELATRRSR